MKRCHVDNFKVVEKDQKIKIKIDTQGVKNEAALDPNGILPAVRSILIQRHPWFGAVWICELNYPGMPRI